MAYLFDTDAISHLFKRVPLPAYRAWVERIHPRAQFTCTPVIGELFAGAFAKPIPHLDQIRRMIIPELTILPFGLAEAEMYGHLRAELTKKGQVVTDIDTQIASCAIVNGLELVTGNRKHFAPMEAFGLSCCWVLADALARASTRHGR